MITVSSLHELHELTGSRAAVVACGVFDGVHRGHQKLLDALLDMAARLDALPVALTFEPHPRTVLEFDAGPPRLTTREQKVELLHHYGAEAVVILDFTSELAGLSARQFLHHYLLSSDISLCGIVVGCNWRFGDGGKGDLAFLQAAGRKHGFEAVGVSEEVAGEELVSSTRIREAIGRGDLESAAAMLGRLFAVRGTVIRGKGIAKSQLERATANLDPDELLLPPPGVYAARSRRIPSEQCRDEVPGMIYDAVVYIGTAPTIHRKDVPGNAILEVHLFDCDEELYGRQLEVSLLSFIREEQSFPNLEALKKQIGHDIETARRKCRNTPAYNGFPKL